ncbi:M12 family metallopeptidase [Rhodococcus pyridinivorans]|uniref:M12 family metallopeptidase n=1 Tax=Rhodococcus pyridinivorans TaxID=103816 RepID=UPI000761F115|nr:M12 family metallopeptidase [Rhodococcus pyridinivorans]
MSIDEAPLTHAEDYGDTGEYRSGPVAGTAVVHTAGGDREVQYADVDGLAVFEGDIVLGTVEEVAAQAGPEGIGITGAHLRWPNATVPFEVDPAFPNAQRITDAVAHWNANTRIRFIARAGHANYVRFRPSTASRSPVGMRGGRQDIEITNNAPVGTVVHEMAHALGLWHEQSREDRNNLVEIRFANIDPASAHNFNQHITDGDDIGAYDFGSVMHYSATAFSTNGQPTIVPRVPLPPGVVMGQRNGLSRGDITAVHTLYPDWSGIGDRWRNIGGVFPPGAPLSVTSRGAGNLDAFITGNDGRVYTSWWYQGNDWSGIGDRWRNIGGVFPKGAPVTAIAKSSNSIDLFITGNDGRVYTSWWYYGSDWSGLGDRWRSIGGFFPPGAPISVTSRSPGNLDLFVTGNDGRVYTSWWYQGGDWSGINNNWRNIGGVFPKGAPVTAITKSSNSIDLFITGNDGRVYTSWWYQGGDWSGIGDRWRSIGGFFPPGAPVAVTSRSAGNLDAFITGNDGRVYTSWWYQGGDWSGLNNTWRNIGGVFPRGAPVSAVAKSRDSIDLFICGNDGCVYTSWWYQGGDWSGIGDRWRNIGGVFPAGRKVTAIARGPKNLDAVICGNDGRVYTSWWKGS